MTEAVYRRYVGFKRSSDAALILAPLLAFVFLAALIQAGFPTPAGAAADETATRGEADTLGLVIRSIETVEGRPLLASIYNVKTGKTIEYTVGDYVAGKLIRDILEDRVILLDEITKFQYVLIFNDTVSVEEEDEEDQVPVVRVREKKRDIDGMDVTYEFNKNINRLAGKDIKYGAGTSEDEERERNKLKRTTKSFPIGKPLPEVPETRATAEVETSKPLSGQEATAETKIAPKKSAAPEGSGAGGTVEVKVAPKTSAASAQTAASPAATTEVGTPAKPSSGQKTTTTKDGTTVKVR